MKYLSILWILCFLLIPSTFAQDDDLKPIITLLRQAENALTQDNLVNAQVSVKGANTLLTADLAKTCDTLSSVKVLLSQIADAETIEDAHELMRTVFLLFDQCTDSPTAPDETNPEEPVYDEIIEAFTSAIDLTPKDAFGYYGRANGYFDTGDYESALVDYDQAIELDPEFANAYYNRGNTYYALGDLEAALTNYDTTVELDPEFTDAYFNRGNAYADLGNLNAAIDNYDSVIDLDAEYVFAYYNRGNAYLNMGEYKAAVNNYDAMLELAPDYANAYFNRGNAHYEQQQYEEAIADYHQYETLTGALEPFMATRISEMQALLGAE